VTLFSKVPWPAIRSVALDVGSRTSAALTQILLRHRHGINPEIRPLSLDEPAENSEAEAVLLIGDRAMHACLPGFAHAYDLGQEWHDWIGLPFVYAIWAVRPGVELGSVVEALQEAKKRGCANVGPIAASEAQRLGLDAGFCRRYLSNIIRFDLGPREQAGMQQYYKLACELGLARPGIAMEYYRNAHALQAAS
jgi:chorismate dehydratase